MTSCVVQPTTALCLASETIFLEDGIENCIEIVWVAFEVTVVQWSSALWDTCLVSVVEYRK